MLTGRLPQSLILALTELTPTMFCDNFLKNTVQPSDH